MDTTNALAGIFVPAQLLYIDVYEVAPIRAHSTSLPLPVPDRIVAQGPHG